MQPLRFEVISLARSGDRATTRVHHDLCLRGAQYQTVVRRQRFEMNLEAEEQRQNPLRERGALRRLPSHLALHQVEMS
jgi:hypothetical protein